MTTINRIIRKAEKQSLRKAEKRNRKANVETHNLTFVHQQLVETQNKSNPNFVMQDQLPWVPPVSESVIKPTSLKELFFLNKSVIDVIE